MDREPSPAHSPDEKPRVVGDSFHVLDQPSPTVDEQSEPLGVPTSPTLDGRADIDTAMLVALRRAMVTDHGLPMSTTRDQQAGEEPSGILGQSKLAASVLAGHPDIDLAVLVALRRASLGE